MEQAIIAAFKGGWDYRGINQSNFVRVERGSMDDDVIIYSKFNQYLVQFERILMAPSFWQSIATATGNDNQVITLQIFGEIGDGRIGYTMALKPYWQYLQRRFIDSLNDQNSHESFFTKLLK